MTMLSRDKQIQEISLMESKSLSTTSLPLYLVPFPYPCPHIPSSLPLSSPLHPYPFAPSPWVSGEGVLHPGNLWNFTRMHFYAVCSPNLLGLLSDRNWAGWVKSASCGRADDAGGIFSYTNDVFRGGDIGPWSHLGVSGYVQTVGNECKSGNFGGGGKECPVMIWSWTCTDVRLSCTPAGHTHLAHRPPWSWKICFGFIE